MLTVDATWITLILGYASDIFADLGSLAIFAIGVPLGFYLLRKTISLARAR